MRFIFYAQNFERCFGGYQGISNSREVTNYTGSGEMIALKNSIKRFVKAGLLVGLNFVKDRPQFLLYVTVVVRKLGLDGVASSIYSRLTIGANSRAMGFNHFFPKDARHLSPSARQIYADLKAAIEHRRKENR